MSAAEPASLAASEPNHAAPQASPSQPTNSDVAPAESTSEANQAAVAIDTPALPPAHPSDETKIVGKESDLDMKATGTAEGAVSGAVVVAPEGDDLGASAKKSNSNNKRRSSTGIPEHKSKKLNKKKSMPTLNLEAKAGDYVWARMKGYPPWPAIVCDEEMLPESLLQTRPVTAMRPDGSYREDFQEGGKNVKDRTYAVMYLSTNEFSWTPNVDLKPIDFAELEQAEQGKKSKQLWSAYELAQEKHELQHFKDLLAQHEEALREEAEEIEKREAEKAAKAEKKAAKEKRKSKPVEEEVVDEDVEMEDAELDEEENEGGKKAKASKKRKKDLESDAEGAKPAKTPKTKLKVNLSKAVESESATKSKAKPKATKTKESPKPPQMSEADKIQKREKEVLYFRHRLQKGFLSTDQPPKEIDMKSMAEYFTSLETHEDLEQSVIRKTKIHKVLKAIIKLSSIPKDEEYHFKQRSMDLLQKWQKILSENADGTDGLGDGDASKTNGEGGDADSGDGEPATTAGTKDEQNDNSEDSVVPAAVTTESAEAPVEKKADMGNGAMDEATDGDVSMTDSKTEATVAPAVPATEDTTSAKNEVKAAAPTEAPETEEASAAAPAIAEA